MAPTTLDKIVWAWRRNSSDMSGMTGGSQIFETPYQPWVVDFIFTKYTLERISGFTPDITEDEVRLEIVKWRLTR